VRANQDAILTFQSSGIVEEVMVSSGEIVEKGDLLVTLEETSLPAQIILARADLVTAQNALEALLDTDLALANARLALTQAREALKNSDYALLVQQEGNRASGETIAEAQANLVLAQSEVDRAQKEYSKYSGRPVDDPVRALARSNLAAARQNRDAILRQLNWYLGKLSADDQAMLEATVEVALANLRQAELEVERITSGPDPEDVTVAQARIAAAQANINLSSVRAPFAGTITLVEVKPGDSASPGQSAVQLFDLSRLFVEAQFSEVDINKIHPGQIVALSFDAELDREYEGIVTQVGITGNVFQGIVNFRILIEITHPDEVIRPGLTAVVNIITSEIDDVLLVPNRAVRLVDGQRVVYILQNGEPQIVPVELGGSADTQSEVVGGGLQEGDQIILNPPTEFERGGGFFN
jgi:HlyD family secretion protein